LDLGAYNSASDSKKSEEDPVRGASQELTRSISGNPDSNVNIIT